MPERIPQSATIRVPLKAYLSSDHISDATGKTIACTISKNGAAFGNPSGGATNATEIGNGWYYVDLSTTDTGTVGPLLVRGTATSTDDVGCAYAVVKATNAGFTALPDAAAEASGGLYTRGTGAGQVNQDGNGRLDANVKAVNGTATPVLGLRKNIAFTAFPFVLLDNSTHQPVTGKTATVTRSLDGGAFAAGTLSNVVEVAHGLYAFDGATGDSNGTYVTFRATASGCDDTLISVLTTP